MEYVTLEKIRIEFSTCKKLAFILHCRGGTEMKTMSRQGGELGRKVRLWLV